MTVNADDSLNETQKTRTIKPRLIPDCRLLPLKLWLIPEPGVISNLSMQTKQFIREYMEKGVQEKALDSTKQDILLKVKESELEGF